MRRPGRGVVAWLPPKKLNVRYAYFLSDNLGDVSSYTERRAMMNAAMRNQGPNSDAQNLILACLKHHWARRSQGRTRLTTCPVL